MASTEMGQRARETIDRIVAELDDDLIRRRFDEPISEVSRQFPCEAEYPVDQKSFNRIIAQVVEQVYHALKVPMALTDPLAQALSLLEAGYESSAYGLGYVPALLDAGDEAGEGLPGVVRALGELLKERQKRMYVSSVFAVHLPLGDWRLRCEIARILLEDYRAFLPEALARCAPAQLVDQIPSLLCAGLHTDAVLRNLSLGGSGSVSAETARAEAPL
jgi:hypothetical protein